MRAGTISGTLLTLAVRTGDHPLRFRSVPGADVATLFPGLGDATVLALFHQFVGSLAHYSLLQQVLRPGRRHLPGRDTFIALVVESFTRASEPSAEGRASAA